VRRDQRDVAGRRYLTKGEINALYFATDKMARPRGWDAPHPIGRFWRAGLVVFFNYSVDTGTVWRSTPAHEPILILKDIFAAIWAVPSMGRILNGLTPGASLAKAERPDRVGPAVPGTDGLGQDTGVMWVGHVNPGSTSP
jgi:hypothetical protein